MDTHLRTVGPQFVDKQHCRPVLLLVDEEQERTLRLLLLGEAGRPPALVRMAGPPAPIGGWVSEPFRGGPAAGLASAGRRREFLIQEPRSASCWPPDFPAQRDFGAGVQSVARYVPGSDARIRQEYRLAA